MNPARREPLLWIQLLGLAALPLEAAALLLVLAGADPGPLPALERLFCWAIGALAPAVLFWQLPPDLWSLLLLQVPLRGRRTDQLRLSSLQGALPLRLLAASGAALLLPLLWWADRHAGLGWSVSPFTTTPRVVVLLLAAALLTLMLWQWQQLIQALWMLSRPAPLLAQTPPLSSADAAERRLNLGLPLLLLAPLQPAAPTPAPASAAADISTPAPSEEHLQDGPPEEASTAPPAEPLASEPAEAEPQEAESKEPEPQSTEPQEPASQATEPQESAGCPEADTPHNSASAALVDAVAIAPEERSEQGEGTDLDQQV